MSVTIEQLSETRRSILMSLKRNGARTASELAVESKLTSEAIRQHLMQLEREGFIERYSERHRGSGRPSLKYRLTTQGEHLFPKHYDSLTVEVLDTVAEHLGPDALKRILVTMTEARVREWEPRLRGLGLDQRLEALKEIYMQDDGYMDVENGADGPALIERNCPFMNVAKRRPVLCSVTVTALTRLLGVSVVREERFQNGDGRCVFRVHPNQPVDPSTVDIVAE